MFPHFHPFWNSCLQQPCLKTASHHLYLVNLDEFDFWVAGNHRPPVMHENLQHGRKGGKAHGQEVWDVIFQLARVVRGKNSQLPTPSFRHILIFESQFLIHQSDSSLSTTHCHVGIHELFKKKLRLWQLQYLANYKVLSFDIPRSHRENPWPLQTSSAAVTLARQGDQCTHLAVLPEFHCGCPKESPRI